MWSPDPARTPRRMPTFAAALAMVAALGLTGCIAGYRPLYGEAAVGYATQDALARIDIAPVGERVGQQVRNELIRAFYPAGQPIDPIYKMTMQISISGRDLFLRKTSEVTRETVELQVSYRIEDPATKQPVTDGVAFAETSYDRYSSEFANIRAQRDAENRAAAEVAEQIKSQVAAALASGRV